jgi:cell wall-associated NlpC family hydrolase
MCSSVSKRYKPLLLIFLIVTAIGSDAIPVARRVPAPDAGVADTLSLAGDRSTPAMRIVKTAMQYHRSLKWSYDAPPPNRYKCNIFVHDIIRKAGLPAPVNPTSKRPVMAARWANERQENLQGWRIVKAGAVGARAGDVVAYHNPTYQESTGHVGIVASNGPMGITISAAGGGSVIIDKLGFDRLDTVDGRKGYVFRRWSPTRRIK